jgi:hypothetical protein
MSKTNENGLAAMLAQYEKNSKPMYEKKSDKVYDLKNYFSTYIKEGVKSATKEVRLLPTQDGTSPFVEFHGHKIQVNGEWKTFACLKHEKNEPCPFCEAREALLATGKETDKELAKNYKARLMYIVKLIDREKEVDGVKFWRFNHDYRSQGIMDKIMGAINALKKNRDITDVENGRDLVVTINRNPQTNAIGVSAIATTDPSPLSEDTEMSELWLNDTRTWEDVYSLRNYDYLEIIVKGGTPVWDTNLSKFVDKETQSTNETESVELNAELNNGLETVKSNMVASKAATKTNTKQVEEEPDAEDEDDLPF